MIYVYGFHLFDTWLQNLRNNKRIDLFFKDNLYKTIAIYGMGIIGRHICDELEKSDIIVKCGIDQVKNKQYKDMMIVSPDRVDLFGDVDAIVITPIDSHYEIEQMLSAVLSDRVDIISVTTVVEYVRSHREVEK